MVSSFVRISMDRAKKGWSTKELRPFTAGSGIRVIGLMGPEMGGQGILRTEPELRAI